MKPLNLSKSEKEKLNILYLAKRAPMLSEEMPDMHIDDGIVSIYHYEIYKILSELNLTVFSSNNLKDIFDKRNLINYVFSLYNRCGFESSEVFISSVCEYLNVGYLGSNPHVRAIAEDKHLMKLIVKSLNILTPLWHLVRRNSFNITPPKFKGPYFIKPRCGASSEFINIHSIQDLWSDSIPHIKKIINNGIDVLVEQYIPGLNITLPVIGHTKPWILPICMTKSSLKGDIVTYRQKRLLDDGLEREVIYSNKSENLIHTVALKIYEQIKPIDYFRIDFRLNEKTGEYYFLEINVCCNLGKHSTIVIPAKSIGISQHELIEHIIAYSIRRQNTIRK